MKGNQFLCTLNNPTAHYKDFMLEDYLKQWHTSGCVYVTGQLEKGEEGTPHVQYFIQYPPKTQHRLSALKKQCTHSHFEIVKQNNGADEYCNKEEGRLDGPFTFGVRPARRNQKGDVKRRNEELLAMGAEKAVAEGHIPISNYLQLKKNLDSYKIATAEPFTSPTVRGVWIYGPSGVGKSTYARANYPNAYDKAQNKWWDGYTGQENVILDDLDNDCLAHHLKIWCDHYACSGESKGGTIPLLHRNFVVTSNYSIEQVFEKHDSEKIAAIKRRFKVIHMDEPFKKQETE